MNIQELITRAREGGRVTPERIKELRVLVYEHRKRRVCACLRDELREALDALEQAQRERECDCGRKIRTPLYCGVCENDR